MGYMGSWHHLWGLTHVVWLWYDITHFHGAISLIWIGLSLLILWRLGRRWRRPRGRRGRFHSPW